eukprot:TRINITY_DN2939_c0_g1_i1.p1 TRINITY_DN2939_c0_g1~~TRINITY_DN2939_c0_g1_i1.p1  ORF type:complete len:669 (+),score=197.33 TRINITY_DN2939_c0_g1_i1:134-2008(+)
MATRRQSTGGVLPPLRRGSSRALPDAGRHTAVVGLPDHEDTERRDSSASDGTTAQAPRPQQPSGPVPRRGSLRSVARRVSASAKAVQQLSLDRDGPDPLATSGSTRSGARRSSKGLQEEDDRLAMSANGRTGARRSSTKVLQEEDDRLAMSANGRTADPTMKGREKAEKVIKTSLDQRKKETQATLRAMEEQQQRWDQEDRELQRWTDQQRHKLDRIQAMIRGEAKGLTRKLNAHELDNLLKMKREVEIEISKKQVAMRERREAEERIELSAEQKCVLYGMEAQRRAKVVGGEQSPAPKSAAERERDAIARLGGTVRTVNRSAQPQGLFGLDGAGGGDDDLQLAPGERIGDRIGRSDAELKRSALEKNGVIASWEERWEQEAHEHRIWMIAQNQRIEEITNRLASRQPGRSPTAEEVHLAEELERLRGAVELRDWQYKDRKRWERTQLPELTDDERRILRGMDSIKKIKQERRRSGAARAEQRAGFSTAPANPPVSPGGRRPSGATTPLPTPRLARSGSDRKASSAASRGHRTPTGDSGKQQPNPQLSVPDDLGSDRGGSVALPAVSTGSRSPACVSGPRESQRRGSTPRSDRSIGRGGEEPLSPATDPFADIGNAMARHSLMN